MVTVVDALNFGKDFGSPDTIGSRKLNENEQDYRSIVNLLTDQIEFADVIILNKTDLITPYQLGELRAIIHSLNPVARIIQSSFSKDSPNEIINTGLFDYDKAEASAGWIQELENRKKAKNTHQRQKNTASAAYFFAISDRSIRKDSGPICQKTGTQVSSAPKVYSGLFQDPMRR